VKKRTAVNLALVVAAASLGVAAPAHASGEWEQRGSDITGVTGSAFGSSVGISADGNTFVAGAPRQAQSGNLSVGTVRVFD